MSKASLHNMLSLANKNILFGTYCIFVQTEVVLDRYRLITQCVSSQTQQCLNCPSVWDYKPFMQELRNMMKVNKKIKIDHVKIKR